VFPPTGKEPIVTRTSKTWLAAITGTRTALLGAVAAATIGGLAISPATAANAAGPMVAAPVAATTEATSAAPAAAAAPAPIAEPAPAAPAPLREANMLANDALLQPNGYYCGPAATRIALSTHGVSPDTNTLAGKLGTTRGGTNSANDITRVLNEYLGNGRYQTTAIPGKGASAQQAEQLRQDIVKAVDVGDPVVANIAGTVTDNAGARHSYPGGHYLTVIGYKDQGATAQIADPADRVGSPHYELPTGVLANWISSRAYSH
jgi:hypothetical protein